MEFELIGLVTIIIKFDVYFLYYVKTHRLRVMPTNSVSGISRWEMDRLLRRRTVENIVNSAQTLNALRRLLLNMQSIVIQDKIQTMIRGALTYLTEVNFFWVLILFCSCL